MKKEQPGYTKGCTLFTIQKICIQPINISVKTCIQPYFHAQSAEPFAIEEFNNVAGTLKILA
ncbi:hypothetical protein [Aeromonas sp. Marseille-Q7275]